MSNYSLVILNQAYIAETIQRTGSEQLLDKATRSFVGFYDAETNWYIPLRANISRKNLKLHATERLSKRIIRIL